MHDVETAIGSKVDVTIPRSPLATASVNQGIPLLQSQGRDPMTKQLRALVERFAPTGAPTSRWRTRAKHRRNDDGSTTS